jgi:hypothetical protein
LAWKPSSHDVNSAAPGVSIEGANIGEHREVGQRAVSLALGENAAAVGAELNSADASVTKQSAGQDAASDSRE